MQTSRAAKRITARRASGVRKPREAAHGTREQILGAASEVLVRQGYARLTTRRVAQVAGITAGNLTYHFPSKRELLRALIERLVAEYAAGIDRFLADLSVPPDKRFKALIEWLMADAASQESNRIFRELWALALHDRFVARAIDDFYDQSIEHIAQMLGRAHPTLPAASANAIVHLLALISEGTGIIYGTRQARAISHAEATALAVDVLTAAVHRAANGK